MNKKVYTREEKAHYANLAWPELILVAGEKKTIFYGVLGKKIGISNPQEVRHALSPIQAYCLNHDEVPHLTSLVVKRPDEDALETDKPSEPGTGFKSKLGSPEKDREAVYAFNWKDHSNPGYAVFLEKAPE